MESLNQNLNPPSSKLWEDYYSVLKPHCADCIKQGIAKEEYAFCSTEKKPMPIYQEDSWGRRGKLLETFTNLYACNVYHWIIYQGASFQKKAKI